MENKIEDRRDMIDKAVIDCLDEMYRKSQPSITWDEVQEQAKENPERRIWQEHYLSTKQYEEIQDKYSDNEIIYIGDIVYDYYETKGFFDESNNDDIDLDVDDLIDFVRKCLKKDTEAEYADEDIEFLVRGELDYEEHLGMWEA